MLRRPSYFCLMVLSLLFLWVTAEASVVSQADSSRYAALDSKLDEYVKAIRRQTLDVQAQECDFLIGSTTDSLLRQRIAERLYYSYLESPVMGVEAVAIHIFDKWFQSGEVAMGSEIELMNSRIHADFNRQSLLGCKAPELVMQTMDGRGVVVQPSDDRRCSVIYFYDADCAKCKIQSVLLRNLLSAKDYPVNFFAVYTGDDKEEWRRYVSDRLTVDAPQTAVFHVWDPEVESDYQRKYGVIRTPRLFLVGPDGIIKGRGLDDKALSMMLDDVFAEKNLDYGSEESVKLFDMILDHEDGISKSDVTGLADQIASATLEKGDTVMFRQMTGDLLYYLASGRTEAYKEGMAYLIDSYIFGQEKVWRSQDDSLKVVGMAEVMRELLSKAEPGSLMPDVKVSGELISEKGLKTKKMNLRKLGGRRNYVMFYAPDCNVCAEQKERLRSLAGEKRGLRCFLINMDSLLTGSPGLASRLFDSFDLTSLPFIVETDAKGVILRRYIFF